MFSIGVVYIQYFTDTLYHSECRILRCGEDFVRNYVAVNTHHDVRESTTGINAYILNYGSSSSVISHRK